MGHRENRKGLFAGMGHTKLLVLAGILAVVLVLLIGLANGWGIDMSLTVNGGTDPVELVFGKDTYVEAGAQATANGDPIHVNISNNIDMSKLGIYTVTYKANYLWVTKTVKRMVKVVDKTAPVITLHTVPGYITLPGETYQEEGFTAIDDHDGDITDKVQTRIEGDTVYYTVSDASGNEVTVERQILHADVVAPTITLLGNSTVSIDAGTAYVDPGYTAEDYIDGDLTQQVQVSGEVNVYHAGTYTVTYTVTDAAGNEATAQRTVIVNAIKQPQTETPGSKVIYLTFDDGPGRYTQQLLDILEQYNAKATFFVVNTGYKMNTLLNAIVDGGHGIGIHSKSHDYKAIYASEEAYFQDLREMQQIIKDATGVTTTMMRFPGGSSNTISKKYCAGIMTKLTQAVTDQGFQYYDWNVSSGDAGGTKITEEVYNNVITGVSKYNVSVVLQHDIQGFSVEAVERILIWGIQNGYSFQALTPNSPACHHKVNN